MSSLPKNNVSSSSSLASNGSLAITRPWFFQTLHLGPVPIGPQIVPTWRPTFKTWEAFEIWLIVIKYGGWVKPGAQPKSQAPPSKNGVMYLSMYLSVLYVEPIWSGKPQLSCSQELRLRELTSTFKWLGTLDLGPYLNILRIWVLGCT